VRKLGISEFSFSKFSPSLACLQNSGFRAPNSEFERVPSFTRMAVFVGLDCGGSSSRVLAIDEHGKALFRGQSGPANLLSTPEAVLQRNLASAARGCPKPDAVCGCFAGLINSEERDKAIRELQSVFLRPDRFAQSRTTRLPWRPAAKADACVIAGTGSIVCSWSEGKVVKSGGRGPILGDPGSAAEIGREMLSLFLTTILCFEHFPDCRTRHLQDDGSQGRRAALYASSSPAKMLASLGKSVAAEAEEGTELAVKIIHDEMYALARLVHLHLEQYGTSVGNCPDRTSGGVWKSGAANAKS